MRTLAEVNHEFESQKVDQVQAAKMLKVTMAYKDLATSVMDLVPDSAHRTAALRSLLESKWTAIQAITHQITATQSPTEGKSHGKKA